MNAYPLQLGGRGVQVVRKGSVPFYNILMLLSFKVLLYTVGLQVFDNRIT